MNTNPLVVADYRADRLYAVDSTSGPAAPIGTGVVAEHVGFIALPTPPGEAPRWAFVDDQRGCLTIRNHQRELARVPVAIPGEHAACDSSGRAIVITTGLGANADVWSDVLNIVDTTTAESVRLRTRVGEPGVVITPDRSTGEPMIVLRHREPGAIEVIPLADARTVGPHVPQLTGQLSTELADDGHGDVVDHVTGIMATATSRGLERFIIDDGTPRPIGIVPWPVEGRPYYLRCDAGRAIGIVRGGPASPTAWTQWTNHLTEIDLTNSTTHHLALPDGLAFRFALGGNRIAVATIHPDGDQLTVISRDGFTVHQQSPLPSMSQPPTPGRLPWDPIGDASAQRRAIAVSPCGETVAVTRGGDAELQLITNNDTHTVTMPTPLNEGGLLYWPGATDDSVGR